MINIAYDIEKIIKSRRIDLVSNMFFDLHNDEIKSGYRIENELWDYKEFCPEHSDKHQWAEIAKDVLSFHNNKGGILIFGVCDRSFKIKRIKLDFDSKQFNDKIRRWLGDSIWIDFHREAIKEDQTYIGIALIPQRGPKLSRFIKDSPLKNGKHIFRKNWSSIRQNDSSTVLKQKEIERITSKISEKPVNNIYIVDEKYYRILSPEYKRFVDRKSVCHEVTKGLCDPRSSVVSLVGIGGVGKTALATWAVLNSYYSGDFDFIISITAKDRELTRYGISAIEAKLTSYETLLDQILEVMDFAEFQELEGKEKEESVKSILENTKTLLFIDNLETVDDERIIDFINDLPVGVRAIVTSRRQRIKYSAYPVEIKPLLDEEIITFVGMISKQNGYSYLGTLSESEMISIGRACDGIPLAIRWIISLNTNIPELKKNSDELKSLGKKGEELLEFSFRRVFENMTTTEKSVVKILSLFNAPIILEAIAIGIKKPLFEIADSIELLVEDTIIYKFFDEDYNDSSYTVLPITRNFILNTIMKPEEESNIRKRLTDWYQGKDIKNPTERAIVQQIRQGGEKPEKSLLNLASMSQKDGDYKSAEEYYIKAIQRNSKSYEALHRIAEFYRHQLKDINRSISYYEQAAQYAPSRGPAKALIYREWGLLLRDYGLKDSANKSIEKLKICLEETPNDNIAAVSLAKLYLRNGNYLVIPNLLKRFIDHPSSKTREMVTDILVKVYENTGEIVKAAEMKASKDYLTHIRTPSVNR